MRIKETSNAIYQIDEQKQSNLIVII